MVYPAGESANLRSHERHLELADRLYPERDGEHDYYGVKEGRSFLLEVLPHLDIVNDLVVDYMHNTVLGKHAVVYVYFYIFKVSICREC